METARAPKCRIAERSRAFSTAALLAAGLAFGSRAAHAADAKPVDLARGGDVPVSPPPVETPYLQFGVAFTAELVAVPGPICAASPCIFGSGGGVVVRAGRRAAGPWYFGAAYEMSKQDSGSLYRFATLQQMRAEVRWYLNTGLDTYPYAVAGGGLAAYGNEWGVDTYGPAALVGVGVETQISRRTVVGFTLSYKLIGLRSFFDSSDTERRGGVVQLFGLDIVLEERNP
ncbi:MAG TPA: hypothetical protein VGI39_14660, partial [Polyangiaceae bacterium]